MITAIVVLFISLIASQFIMIGAIKQLSDEDKVKLMSGRQLGRAQIRSVVVIAIALLYYYAVTTFPDYATYLLVSFIISMAGERVYNFFNAQKRIETMGLPLFYKKKFVLATIISSVGLILFFMLLLKDVY